MSVNRNVLHLRSYYPGMIKVNLKKKMQLKDHECSVNGMDVKVRQETPDSTPFNLHQNLYIGVQFG